MMLKKLLDARDMIEMLVKILIDKKATDSLSYSEAELLHIERQFETKFEKGHEHKTTTAIPLGFYLGEMIIRKFPGSKWDMDTDVAEENLVDFVEITVSVNVGSGATVKFKPFLRAIKFMKDKTDNLSVIFRHLNLQTEIAMDDDYWNLRKDSKGWVQFAWGDQIRMFKTENNGEPISPKDWSKYVPKD